MNYRVTLPQVQRIPILLSVPHCGTAFPDEIKHEYASGLMKAPDDTDWFVDDLYGFAARLGITMISAVWSRWVIDLNRNPESKALYNDGRIITDLCPATTFLGEPIYNDRRKTVANEEVQRRKQLYFEPYHRELNELLADMRREFGVVLLWDCHSIRQRVATIRPGAFPDLILGDADGASAHRELIHTALARLATGPYSLHHNHPFKGGFITRHYGKPHQNQHALQLEMTKINYMDDTETRYHAERAKKMKELLYNTLADLSTAIISIKD